MKDTQGTLAGTALDTVIVFTRRMESLAAFYQQALGLGPYQLSPHHMGQKVGNVYLGFDQVAEHSGGSPSSVSLWFTVDDLQSTFDRVVGMGAEVRYAPTDKPWGARLAAVVDPDGNILGLSQRRPAVTEE